VVKYKKISGSTAVMAYFRQGWSILADILTHHEIYKRHEKASAV
jgi:hypothetical protein